MMTAPQNDDAALIQRVRDGDIEAFTPLVERYRTAVYGVAHACVHNAEDARDIAQEAFVQAYVQLPTLRDTARFGPWLRRIVLNLARMHLRRRPLSLSIDAVPAITDEFAAIDTRLTVDAALECLSDETRLTVVLFYLHNLPLNDIAAFQDVPVTTIKSRLRDARARLRKEMLTMLEDTLPQGLPSASFTADVAALVLQAARAGDAPQVRALVDARPSLLGARDELDENALITAARHGQAVVVLALLDKGAPPLPSGAIDIAMSVAAHFGHTDIVRALLETGANIDVTSDDGATALLGAIGRDFPATAHLLLDSGANLNLMPPEHRCTPLMYAVWHGRRDIVERLLALGADHTVQSALGRTALSICEERDRPELAQLLREAGAGP